jgi:hypothetical protein
VLKDEILTVELQLCENNERSWYWVGKTAAPKKNIIERASTVNCKYAYLQQIKKNYGEW